MGDLEAKLHPALRSLWRFGRAELAALAAMIVAAGGLLAFLEIADEMEDEEGRSVDWQVLDILRPSANPHDPWGPPWIEHAMLDLTSFGGVANLAVIAVAAVIFLLIQRRAASALLLMVSLGGGLALSETIKALFGRDRPPIAYRAMETLNASFPSGHALLSTVTYLTLGALLAQAMQRKRLRVFVFGVAVFLALIVGLSRIYLGVHWTTDVLAGWSLGAAWAMVCWLAAWAVKRWLAHYRMKTTPHEAEAGIGLATERQAHV